MSAPERRPLPYAWDDIRARLQRNIDSLLMQLLPGFPLPPGRAPFTPLNPTRDDHKPGSFVIWRETQRAGAWHDYACGDKGDVFQLIGYVEGLAAPIDAYWWALYFLGLDRDGPVRADGVRTPRTKAEDVAARERREREALAEAARAKTASAAKSKALFALWLGLPPLIGSPAERYLREVRGIDLSRLKHPPGALRWCEEADWIEPETGEIKTWRHCMVSAVTQASKVTGLHRTDLKPDGSGKAREKPAKCKFMFGDVRGGAIRLSAGPSGLSPEKAELAGRVDPLVIGEGIETTLTVACARPDFRAWAAGSLSLMGALTWPVCASAVVLLGENDESPGAVDAFARVEAHWRDQAKGRPFTVVRPERGKDHNDWGRAA